MSLDLNDFYEVIPPGLTITDSCKRLYIHKRFVIAVEQPGVEEDKFYINTTVPFSGKTRFLINPKYRQQKFPCFGDYKQPVNWNHD